MIDLIDRQVAIDALNRCTDVYHTNLPPLVDKEEVRRALASLPSTQSEIIRCKDCKWWGYDDDDGVVRMCHAAKHNYVSPHWNVFICRTYKGDFYCADAEEKPT